MATAQASPDRRARVAACELLHTAALWSVGSLAQAQGQAAAAGGGGGGGPAGPGADAPGGSLLQRLLGPMLVLGAGAEPVGVELFGLLLQQVVRWFARQAEGEHRAALLEALLSALSAAADGSARGLCANLCALFLSEASGRQEGAAAGRRDAALLLRRLFDRLGGDRPGHRLGAALAIMTCAPALGASQHHALLQRFLLSALAHVLSALRAAERDAPGLGTAALLEGAADALLDAGWHSAAAQLVLPLRERERFATLADFAAWLWEATRAPQRHLRRRAQELLELSARQLLAGALESARARARRWGWAGAGGAAQAPPLPPS